MSVEGDTNETRTTTIQSNTPSQKPLSAAANRVAGTFSRLTRLRTRPVGRTQPAPHSAEPDLPSRDVHEPSPSLYTQRPDAYMRHEQPTPVPMAPRSENPSGSSLEAPRLDRGGVFC